MRRLFPRVSPSSDCLADSVDALPASTAELQEDVQNASDVDVDSPTVPLGLRFSFPVEQTALDKGYLTRTKGFNAVIKDVVRLLQDALTASHVCRTCERRMPT